MYVYVYVPEHNFDDISEISLLDSSSLCELESAPQAFMKTVLLFIRLESSLKTNPAPRKGWPSS